MEVPPQTLQDVVSPPLETFLAGISAGVPARQQGPPAKTPSAQALKYLLEWGRAERPKGVVARSLVGLFFGLSILLFQLLVVTFMLRPAPRFGDDSLALEEHVAYGAKKAGFVEADVTQAPAPRRQLWCVYEPGREGYLLSDVPVQFCNVVVYCCVDLGYRGIRYFRSDVDEGHAGIDLFHTLKDHDFNVDLYAFVGDGVQTTSAFHEKLAGVNLTKLIGSVRTWMHSKHIAGLVFYHRRHNKPSSADAKYKEYFQEFVYELGKDNLLVSAVVPFYNSHPKGDFSIAQFLGLSPGHLVLRAHDVAEIPTGRAICPVPFSSSDARLQTLFHYFLDVRQAYTNFSHNYARRLMFTMSILGTQYRLRHPRNFKELSPAEKLQDSVSYSTMCALVKMMGFSNFTTNEEGDCLVVHKGQKWYSGFGPHSTRIFSVTNGYAGVLLFGMYSDDYRGVCGQKHPLVRHVHDSLGIS